MFRKLPDRFLIGLLFGDITGSSALIFASRSIVTASYTREAEQNADTFSINVMHRLGRPTKPWGEGVAGPAHEKSARLFYLAAGRPVITQETGFGKFLPSGKGLFGFKTMEDILKAVDCIESDYAGNCRAAREIAAEFFAAEKVIGSLMARAGL